MLEDQDRLADSGIFDLFRRKQIITKLEEWDVRGREEEQPYRELKTETQVKIPNRTFATEYEVGINNIGMAKNKVSRSVIRSDWLWKKNETQMESGRPR